MIRFISWMINKFARTRWEKLAVFIYALDQVPAGERSLILKTLFAKYCPANYISTRPSIRKNKNIETQYKVTPNPTATIRMYDKEKT